MEMQGSPHPTPLAPTQTKQLSRRHFRCHQRVRVSPAGKPLASECVWQGATVAGSCVCVMGWTQQPSSVNTHGGAAATRVSTRKKNLPRTRKDQHLGVTAQEVKHSAGFKALKATSCNILANCLSRAWFPTVAVTGEVCNTQHPHPLNTTEP